MTDESAPQEPQYKEYFTPEEVIAGMLADAQERLAELMARREQRLIDGDATPAEIVGLSNEIAGLQAEIRRQINANTVWRPHILKSIAWIHEYYLPDVRAALAAAIEVGLDDLADGLKGIEAELDRKKGEPMPIQVTESMAHRIGSECQTLEGHLNVARTKIEAARAIASALLAAKSEAEASRLKTVNINRGKKGAAGKQVTTAHTIESNLKIVAKILPELEKRYPGATKQKIATMAVDQFPLDERGNKPSIKTMIRYIKRLKEKKTPD